MGAGEYVDIAGIPVPDRNPAAAKEALDRAQKLQAANPAIAPSAVRPVDPATGQAVALTPAGIPLTNPYARMNFAVPKLGIRKDDTTLDVIGRLTASMESPGTSPQAASRLYDIQQMLWESAKGQMSVWTGR